MLKSSQEISDSAKKLLIRACRSVVALSSLFSNHIHLIVDLLCSGIRKQKLVKSSDSLFWILSLGLLFALTFPALEQA